MAVLRAPRRLAWSSGWGRTARLWAGLAPALLLALVALSSAICLFAVARPLARTIGTVVPLDSETDPLFLFLSAIALGALSIGLLRSKEVAWWLALATLAGALFCQSRDLEHPLRLIIVGGVLAILLADRGRYTVQTGLGWRRIIVGLVVVLGALVALETALVVAATGAWPAPMTILGEITATIGNAVGMSDAQANQILRGASRDALLGSLILVSRLPWLLAAFGVLTPVADQPVEPSTKERCRDIARRYGCGALLPFQLGEEKRVFSAPDVDGLIVYGLAGRTAIVLGDPIGPAEVQPGLFADFLACCHKQDRSAVVYQATSASNDLLVKAGYRVFKVGEEAVIDLAAFDLGDPRRANVRHTITRCRRDGNQFRWFPDGIPAEESDLLDQMRKVDAIWFKKQGPRMGFTISGYDRESLSRQPVAVSVDPNGQVIGFASFRSTGSDRGYVLDLMRRIENGAPGAVEGCIAEAARAFKAGGAPTLSLGLVPLAGLHADRGPIEERILAVVVGMAKPWYDIRGLTFYKRKFDPIWVPRYGAIRRRRNLLGFMIALVRVHVSDSMSIHLPGRRRALRAAE